MIPLLISFFVLGSLLCVLIGADEQAGADSGSTDPDPLECWRSAPVRVESRTEGESGPDHTAPGLAGGQ